MRCGNRHTLQTRASWKIIITAFNYLYPSKYAKHSTFHLIRKGAYKKVMRIVHFTCARALRPKLAYMSWMRSALQHCLCAHLMCIKCAGGLPGWSVYACKVHLSIWNTYISCAQSAWLCCWRWDIARKNHALSMFDSASHGWNVGEVPYWCPF